MFRMLSTVALAICLCSVTFAQTSKKNAVMQPIGKEEFLQKVFNFEQATWWKYEGVKPCIVNFYASWNGPCRTLEPILEELAEKYQDQIVVYKVDIEKEKELVAAFGIRSLPVLLFCPLGGKPETVAGSVPYETLDKSIQNVLIKSINSSRKQKKVGW